MNPFFAEIALIGHSVEVAEEIKKDTSNEVSYLVAGDGLEPPTSGL